MAGQIDVMWDTLLYTPERAKKLDFVVYMNAATGMLVAKGNLKNIHAVGDLCGLTDTRHHAGGNAA
jgi:polar amino acid transport system substrate-binding protein